MKEAMQRPSRAPVAVAVSAPRPRNDVKGDPTSRSRRLRQRGPDPHIELILPETAEKVPSKI